MEGTPSCIQWSELPMDILRSVFELLSFVDFNRAKLVNRNWYLCSKQTSPRIDKSPWLILFPHDGGCALYNPNEARVYKTKRDLSDIRFLANSGNWFLVLDSKLDLCIIDLFSDKKIHLPALDMSTKSSLGRQGTRYSSAGTAGDLRGLLWVDEKKEEYVVVWYFGWNTESLAFCKNGEDHYRKVPGSIDLEYICDIVLIRGDSIYISRYHDALVTKHDLSGQEGSKVMFGQDIETLFRRLHDLRTYSCNVAVTLSGEVLLVESIVNKSTMSRIFYLYKKGSKDYDAVKVDSLGDEAMLLDLGITVPADHTLGIEPNSIYFTRDGRACNLGPDSSCLDICVFNLATKTIKRFFPGLGLGPSNNLSIKDARWFLPS
ncbi:hypothetical protein CARUB_v10003616mg [Capsella rubella]|uniref:F-box domain-containing protein n=1 Tax=Capsella rubella TaxID=81985 RepID=R0H0Y9_9BRAS|nr:F-box protein At5g25290 [Capsella rubella]EOA22884.1 hypothetical protein CARUB_v10003616mg [Capsella rubella]